ncbi:caspase family protein [Streptomyces decoyicus]|uniref:caspase family protein n=1 Tax=Streptomyces decoyicus TaxID=249567 RepID=UPI0034043661
MSGLWLATPAASRAVLIGVHEYKYLPSLPAVRNNLTGLADTLTDERIWGLPRENVVTVPQPEKASDLVDSVADACAQATDTVVIYYAGHGLTDDEFNGELYLALPGSRKFRPDTTCAYDYLRREMIRDRRTHGKQVVIILDCCYSGRALRNGMSPGEDLADLADVRLDDGMAGNGARCLLTAASASSIALAPPGETYTAFTGALLRLLNTGVPEHPGLLDMDTVYNRLQADLRALARPQPSSDANRTRHALPEFGSRGSPRRICIAKNVSTKRKKPSPAPSPEHVRAPAPTPPSPSGVPARMGSLVREYLRSQPAVPGLHLIDGAPGNKVVQQACKAHQPSDREEVIAVWLWRSAWSHPEDSLALTSSGLRVGDNGTYLHVPYEEFGQYTFDSPYRFKRTWWDTSGHRMYRLRITGPQSWSSKEWHRYAPETIAERLQHIRTIAAG